MPGDDVVKRKKGADKVASAGAELDRATQELDQVTKQATEAIAKAQQAVLQAHAQSGPGRAPGAGPVRGGTLGAGTGGAMGGNSGQHLTGSISSLEVSFDPTSAPPPAFAGVAVVHRFPEYVLVDFGSIDPLQIEPTATGQKAMLQHVGRVCLPESTARRLLMDLQNIYGQPAG